MNNPQTISSAADHLAAGRMAAAKAACVSVLEHDPQHAEALHMLGIIARDEQQPGLALELVGRALAIAPTEEMYCTLGSVYLLRGDSDSAARSYSKAVEIAPGHARAHSNLGVVLHRQGKISESIVCFRTAAALHPHAETCSNLGCALKDTAAYPEAVAWFEKALAEKPDDNITFSNLLFCLNHMEKVGQDELYAWHRRFGSLYDAVPPMAERIGGSRDPERRLRIGFVSGDLRLHAVACYIEPLWREIAPESCEIWVYANHHDEDVVTRRLKKYAARWRTVGAMGDDALARGIARDGVDILFDLSGHTAGNRLPVFARRPAPLQASWIGYAGTTGLEAMDYYFADNVMAPESMFDRFFTEKIVRLPAVSPFEPYGELPPVSTLPALRNGFMTFGSFNRTAKLEESCISLWSRVLAALPDSRMLLGNISDEEQRCALTERFARYGISGERLVFHPLVGMRDYLSLHGEVDLILDTFPYAGCTTTAYAIWMGVPVLTLTGATMATRLGATMLNQFGLTQFTVAAPEEFLNKAVEWANNPAGLEELRLGLRKRLSGEISGHTFAVCRAFEKAVRMIWQRHCAGEGPVAFSVE